MNKKFKGNWLAAPQAKGLKSIKVTEETRLNVLLQQYGVASRRKADELIALGKVKIDNVVVRTMGTRVQPGSSVSVDNFTFAASVPKMTFLFHKPDLCLTARATQEETKTTIFDLKPLRGIPANVQAVGRLDFRSEGLLILTNDGELAYALSHPKFSVPKTYAVLLASPLTKEEMNVLKTGVTLDDGVARALAVRSGSKAFLGSEKRGQWIEVVLDEGRNRLIRRMMEALGLKVVRLVRIGIGEVTLPDNLQPGQLRPIDTPHQIYLDQIKGRMHKLRETPTNIAAIGLTTHDIKARKAKKRSSLNNENYEIERQRRSATAGMAKKGRESRYEKSTPAPRAKLSDRAPAERKSTGRKQSERKTTEKRTSERKTSDRKIVSKKPTKSPARKEAPARKKKV